MKVLTILWLLVLFIGCNREFKKEKVLYYDNTSIIKAKYCYYDKKDTTSYSFYGYYSDGNLKEEYSKKEGKLNGKQVEYYQNGQIRSIVNFIDDEAEGLVQVFNDKGKLEFIKTYRNDRLNGQYVKFGDKDNIQVVLLNINDKPIIRVDKGNSTIKNELIYGATYYYHDHDIKQFLPIGSLIYNFNGGLKIKEQKSCTYFETIAKDTLKNGDSLKIEIISNIGLHQGHNISLFLGEIDEYYNFVDSSKVKLYKSDSNVLKITISPKDYQPGVNLITGKLRVYKEGQEITQKYMLNNIDNIPYIFFKQFYVLDNNPAK